MVLTRCVHGYPWSSLIFTLPHGWMRRFHGSWLRLSDEQFDALHYFVSRYWRNELLASGEFTVS
jgi:hypothetical protein